MNTPQETVIGPAIVRRYIDDEHEVVFSRADFTPIHDAWQDHARLWDVEPDPLGQVLMRQALGGAALYLANRPRDEHVAFTLNLSRPPMNVFVTGDSRGQAVTGRIFTEDVATTERSRLFVQTLRGDHQHTSVIEVGGLDFLEILEQFARQSDQAEARYFELDDSEYLAVHSLPVRHREWLQDLNREQARERLKILRPLDERSFWFQCGCDPDRMLTTMQTMFAGREDELFGGEESIRVTCPRCGRFWRLTRDAFGG